MHWYPLFGAADTGYIGREILDSMRSAKKPWSAEWTELAAREPEKRRRALGPFWHLVLKVCCPDAPCFEERSCLHLAFLTSREATVLRARLIRASNASEPHRRREVIGVPGPCLTRVATGPVKTGGRPRR